MQWLVRLGRLSFGLLVLCIMFQAIYVAMAWAVARFTDPPACQVGFAFPLPFASCPQLGFGLAVDYALALPGAVLAFPFILPNLLTTANSALQPFIVVPTLIHLFAGGFVLHWALRKVRP